MHEPAVHCCKQPILSPCPLASSDEPLASDKEFEKLLDKSRDV